MSLPNTIIIPHGMTEVRLVQWLLSELKTRAIIYRPYGKSERTVSMKEIGGILSSAPFTTVQKMHKAFEELEYDRRTGLRDVKAIPILDVDADRRSLGMYKSCDMFDSFCLGKENVIPVYNDPNIEAVIAKAGYGKVAHNLGEFQEFLDSTDIDEFRERMRSCDSTNMEVMIDHLCRFIPKYQR